MKELHYTILLQRVPQGFVVWVPCLPGCMTQGATYEEALQMAKEVIPLWIETLMEEGEEVPEENPDDFTIVKIEVEAPIPVA